MTPFYFYKADLESFQEELFIKTEEQFFEKFKADQNSHNLQEYTDNLEINCFSEQQKEASFELEGHAISDITFKSPYKGKFYSNFLARQIIPVDKTVMYIQNKVKSQQQNIIICQTDFHSQKQIRTVYFQKDQHFLINSEKPLLVELILTENQNFYQNQQFNLKIDILSHNDDEYENYIDEYFNFNFKIISKETSKQDILKQLENFKTNNDLTYNQQNSITIEKDALKQVIGSFDNINQYYYYIEVSSQMENLHAISFKSKYNIIQGEEEKEDDSKNQNGNQNNNNNNNKKLKPDPINNKDGDQTLFTYIFFGVFIVGLITFIIISIYKRIKINKQRVEYEMEKSPDKIEHIQFHQTKQLSSTSSTNNNNQVQVIQNKKNANKKYIQQDDENDIEDDDNDNEIEIPQSTNRAQIQNEESNNTSDQAPQNQLQQENSTENNNSGNQKSVRYFSTSRQTKFNSSKNNQLTIDIPEQKQ